MMLYNDTTWNRLNRFFNIFNPKVYKYLLVLNVILLMWSAFYIIGDKKSFAECLFTVLLVNLIVTTVMLFRCPKKLFLHKGTAEFEEYISLRPTYMVTRGFWWLKVSYTVTEIGEIQFCQNAFEKLFNTGRISFSGETTFTAKRDEDRIKIKEPFVICGIRNFSEFQKTHSEYRKDAE